jgi:N-acetylmuramoyl-L-alanine amidase CwlA
MLSKVESVTVHWIGPYPQQSVYTPFYWWRDGTDGLGIAASAHYIIKDDTVLQAIPATEIAYHCGNTVGNATSIGIEVIPMDITGQFSQASIDSLRQVISTWAGLPIKRHYDWTGKNCPLYYTPFTEQGEKHWSDLLQEVTHA